MKYVASMILAVFFTVNVSSGEEHFSGQENLSELLKAVGVFEGAIFLLDTPSGNKHESRMFLELNKSIPVENILTFKGTEGSAREIEVVNTVTGWVNGFFEEAVKKNAVRVIHVPTLWHHHTSPFVIENKVRVLKDQDILAVYAAGNMHTIAHLDVYQPDDPYWGSDFEYGGHVHHVIEYQAMKQLFQSGHAIMATYAIKKPATFKEYLEIGYHGLGEKYLRVAYQNAIGGYIRNPRTASFGDMKEYGFTAQMKSPIFTYEGIIYGKGMSSASAQVAAFAFYLRQLWDTTAEVLDVMKKTAIDIGAPGVDEDFGWGLINANHPIIWDRAIEKLEESLRVCLWEDMSFEQAISVAKGNFDLFHDIRRDKREIGFTFGAGKSAVALAAGHAAGPFGLSSKFLRQQNAVVQVGIRRHLTKIVSVVGVYGRSNHEDVSLNKGSIGINCQKHFSDSRGNLSLYVGHRSIWGSLGIPGYKMFDMPRTPFSLHMIEARTSFSLLF